jgi:Flp pilus assembly protein TadG
VRSRTTHGRVPSGHRGEEGAALLEAALAIPIVLLLLSGTVDLGFWVFERTQVANAARDGARAGILQYSSADAPGSFSSSSTLTAGSADQQIQAAIASHLAGRAFSATVACYTAGGTTTTPCSGAKPGTDEVQVTVTASRPSYSFIGPVFGTNTVTAKAALPVVGLPVPMTTTTTTGP